MQYFDLSQLKMSLVNMSERSATQFRPFLLRFHVSVFCLSHNLVYLLYFCSSWDRG